jgi:hypothetical protein
MLPPSEETKVLAPDSYLLLNSCGFKVVQGTFLGAFVGVAMGLFMSAMGAGESALQIVQGREVPAAPVTPGSELTLAVQIEDASGVYDPVAFFRFAGDAEFTKLGELLGGRESVVADEDAVEADAKRRSGGGGTGDSGRADG